MTPASTTDAAAGEAPVNREAEARARRERVLSWAMPAATMIAAIALWEWWVRAYDIPHYLIPAPSRILATLVADGPSLAGSAWFTVRLTIMALALAVVGGVTLGALFALSRPIEMSLFPFAVILQVTPVVAIAPLILIYAQSTFAALLICAWIVAFFPILSGTVVGLRSADHNLRDLFTLYRATPWQRLRYLLAPSALPFFMASLKVAGGLSLIGAVVAEFVAGTTGRNTGLASRIIESSYRNEIPRMFAALVLVSALGIAIFALTAWASRRVLGHWHESEIRRET